MHGADAAFLLVLVALEAVLSVLSHAIYCVILLLGVMVHIMLTVGSLIVAVGAVVLCAIGVYLALENDIPLQN